MWRVPDFFGNAPTTQYTVEIGGEWVSGGYSQQYNLLLPTDSVSPLTSFTFENITNVDGYTPKYKKCLSYQYINPSIILNNQVITFNKNMFNNPEKMIINVNYELKGDSNLYIVPYQYEGSNQENYTHCISTKLSNAVQISADNSVYIKSNVEKIASLCSCLFSLRGSFLRRVIKSFKSFAERFMYLRLFSIYIVILC